MSSGHCHPAVPKQKSRYKVDDFLAQSLHVLVFAKFNVTVDDRSHLNAFIDLKKIKCM